MFATRPANKLLAFSLLLNACLVLTAVLYLLLREDREPPAPESSPQARTETRPRSPETGDQRAAPTPAPRTGSLARPEPTGKESSPSRPPSRNEPRDESAIDETRAETGAEIRTDSAPAEEPQYRQATRALTAERPLADTEPPAIPPPPADLPPKTPAPPGEEPKREQQLVDSSRSALPPTGEPVQPVASPDIALPPRGDRPIAAPPATDPGPAPAATFTTKISLKAMENISDRDKTITMTALASLQKYLAATSWEERVPLARRGKIDRGRIRSYYADREPGPIVPLGIEFVSIDTRLDSGQKFVIFNIRTREIPEGFPVIVDEEDGEFKVAWRIFAEFHDDLLARFISGWKDEPESFHVYMNRKHYFGNDVPDLDSLVCFLIETPVPDRKVYVFVDRISEIAKELASEIPWGFRGHPVVQLQWTRGSDGRPYIRIQSIERYGWSEE